MMDRNERDRLLEELEHRLGRMRGRMPGQIGEMWEFALRCNRAFENGASEGHFSGPINDAIPYIPTEVQQCAGGIDESMRLLDIGCFGGYGLFDFAMARWRAGLAVPMMVGIDIDEVSVRVSKELAAVWGHADGPVFVCGNAEGLPFRSSEFDWVIGRLLLPYVRIRESLAELARVMVPGGHLLLQTHGPRYYLRRIGQTAGHARLSLYYFRALAALLYYWIQGRQGSGRWLKETAMTDRMLERTLGNVGLRVLWRHVEGLKPLYLCVRN